MNTFYEWLAAICTILLMICAVLVAEQRDSLKAEAVKRGFAEWLVNPSNGQTTFQWKELP